MCSATPSDLANNARVWKMWGSTYHGALQRINRRIAQVMMCNAAVHFHDHGMFLVCSEAPSFDL